jgi:predicted porin
MKQLLRKRHISAAVLTAVLLFGVSALAEVSDAEFKEGQDTAMDRMQKNLEHPATAGAAGAQVPSAKPVKSSSDLKVELYGQLNRAIMWADNGHASHTFFVDGDNSSTRIGINASKSAGDWLTIGTRLEVEFESNSSSLVTLPGDAYDDSGNNHFKKRHLVVYARSPRLGTLSLGHTSTASDDSAEMDLSGTLLADYSYGSDFGNSISFWNSSANATSGLKEMAVIDNMDGLFRRDLLRYDSPRSKGFQISMSAIEKGAYDIALTYGGKWPFAEFAAALAYANPGALDSGVKGQVDGSASMLFNSGLSLTVAGGYQDKEATGASDADFYYVKLGCLRKVFTAGATALSVSYGRYHNLTDGYEGTSYGFGFVQKFSKWSTELYAGYRVYALDYIFKTHFNDIHVLFSGARVKF